MEPEPNNDDDLTLCYMMNSKYAMVASKLSSAPTITNFSFYDVPLADETKTQILAIVSKLLNQSNSSNFNEFNRDIYIHFDKFGKECLEYLNNTAEPVEPFFTES
jgi:hypothetical protein